MATIEELQRQSREKAAWSNRTKWAKKAAVEMSDRQLLLLLIERAHGVLAAHLKGEGDLGLEMRELQRDLWLAEKRLKK